MLNHKGTITLETERLILRRFKPDDLEQIFYNCWSDPDVWKWTNYEPMNSIDDVLTLNNIFTDFWFAKYEKPDFYNWAIQLKSTGEVIGRIWGIRPDDRVCQNELAYELGQKWWNQGLMTEAVKAVIGFFFNEVGFNRIYAGHANENPASGKVMQKSGMIYEGTMRQACKNNNGVFDNVSYAIIADDYFKEKLNNTLTDPNRNNIIITGVPRAGKTTLCRMLMRHGYTHISMDALIAGFEQCYPETGINTYQDLSSMETLCVISKKIAPFIRAMIEGEYSGYEGERAVFDVYQLLPEDYTKHLAPLNCTAYWIGSSDCTADERFEILKANDTEQHYTFYKSETELREGCGYIVEQSRLLKQECEKYGLPYSDTTYSRDTILNMILSNILEEREV